MYKTTSHPSTLGFDAVMRLHTACEDYYSNDNTTDSDYMDNIERERVLSLCDPDTKRDVFLTYRHAHLSEPCGC